MPKAAEGVEETKRKIEFAETRRLSFLHIIPFLPPAVAGIVVGGGWLKNV